MIRLLAAACALAIVAGCTSEPPADLILRGGRVVTLDDEGPTAATAVAVRGGRIVKVGADKAVLDLRGPRTQVIDLVGAVVVPGLCDSHMHLMGLGKALAEIGLEGTDSVEACLERVAAAAADAPEGAWLQGRGWDQNDWSDPSWPTREQLDAVTGGHPCLLRRVDGHAAWANSAALAAAGLDASSPDPAGGEVVRRADGTPAGVLIDNAVDLVRAVVPPPGDAEKAAWIRGAAAHCAAHGVTAVHDAGVSWETAGLIRRLAGAADPAERLPVRWYGMIEDTPASLDAALAAGPLREQDGMVTLRAVKLYADGALGSRGALLLRDYSDRPGHRGLAVTSVAHLDSTARRAADAGFQVATHAIGDGANREVLDLYAAVFAGLPAADRRWRIEHAQIVDPEDIPRFGAMGVIAAMQPVHCTSDMDWAAERLGPDRLAGAYAWRSLLDGGAHVCGGTDAPVELIDPLAGIYAARTRQHADGTPVGGWQPQERLDGPTALRVATREGAYAAFMEHELGMIREGFRADLTVLDGDPATCAPERLLTMGVLLTVVDGRVVHDGREIAARGR